MKPILIIFLLGAVCSSPTTSPVSSPTTARTITGGFVPIKKIPGTDLYTGVFYKMGMKKFPTGWITWTDQSLAQNVGNFVQIDVNSKNLPFYKPGEKWYNDIQWMMEPTEKDGFFVLRNKATPTGMVTSKVEKAGGYRHLIVAKDVDILKKLSPNGPLRSEALMKPVQITDDKQSEYKYQLKMFSHPEGAITWTETKYGEGGSKYIQVSENEGHRKKYEKGQEWWDDTLFSLKPPEVTTTTDKMSMVGYLSHMELTDDIKTILDKYEKHVKTTVVKMMTLGNPDAVRKLENITIGLHDVVDKTEGSMKINEGSLPSPIVFGAKFRLPSLRVGKDAFGLTKLVVEPIRMEKFDKIKLTTKSTFEVMREIELPPKSSVDVNLVTSVLEKVELPFRAMMVIEGEGDRMMGDYSGIKKGPMPPEFVMGELKRSGMKVDNMRVVGNKVVMWVTGLLTGDFNIGSDLVA